MNEAEVESEFIDYAIKTTRATNASPYIGAATHAMTAYSRLLELRQILFSWKTTPPKAKVRADAYAENRPGITLEWGAFATPEDRETVSLLGSEVLHHLRASVDHIVYAASEIHAGPAPKGTGFPAAADDDAWADKQTKRKIRLLSDEHLERVRIVQPCHGGTWAGKLAKLSNADKHRTTVEVLPTLKFKVRRDSATPDPQDPRFLLLEVIDPTIDVTIHGYHADGSALDQLEELLVGVVSFLNPFLRETGESEISVGAQTDAAD